jgi:hypothetical protein
MQLPSIYDVLLLILPALALILSWVHHARASRGHVPPFRSLKGVATFEKRADEVAEGGLPIHIATGASEPGAAGPTAATLASLVIAQRIAEAVIRRGGRVIATTGDIVSLAAVRGSMRRAYRETGFAADYRGSNVQLVAHQAPIPYAAGVAQRYAVESMDMSVVVGDYGAEALLIGEEGAARRMPQISGAVTLSALPALALSTDATLIGEELFALEAYLTPNETAKARLVTQDTLRRVIVLLIVAGIVYQALNVALQLNLPSL